MLKQLTTFLNNLNTQSKPEPLTENELNLAKAALLVEVATSDQNFDQSERDQLLHLLVEQCHLSNQEAQTLISEATDASADSASLYDFTQHINQQCDYEQKKALVSGMWQVAYADGEMDKYEEHIIRRIADLIHVSHVDFINLKISVRDSQ